MLTLADVRTIHHKAMAPVWEVVPHPAAAEREPPGAYREHEIRPFPGGMIPPSWPLVPGEMTTWIEAANSLDPSVPTFPEQLAILHCRFEQIHPFLDGNGRVGRLAINLILVRNGYPPAIIYKRERDRYIRALQRADAGEPGTLGALIARAILDTLYQHVIPAVAGPARLVPLAALATPSLKAPALRAAASRGRLQATRGQTASGAARVPGSTSTRRAAGNGHDDAALIRPHLSRSDHSRLRLRPTSSNGPPSGQPRRIRTQHPPRIRRHRR